MNVITFIIALIQMGSSKLENNPWTDALLDKMVGIEAWFYGISWWVWGVFLFIAIGVTALMFIYKKKMALPRQSGCGCLSITPIAMGIVFLIWPLAEWLSLFIITGLADSFGPEGITNTGKFISYLFLYVLFGVG